MCFAMFFFFNKRKWATIEAAGNDNDTNWLQINVASVHIVELFCRVKVITFT